MTEKKEPWQRSKACIRLTDANRKLLGSYYKSYPLTNFSKLLNKSLETFVKSQLEPRSKAA